jgi:hypothetical protein
MRGVPRASALAFGASLALALVTTLVAHAQRVLPGRPLTLVVGASPGATTTDRLDGARSNASTLPLPASSLRVLWSRQTHPMSRPPVVLQDGTVVVLANDGEATFLFLDGTTAGHLDLRPGPLSAPSVLADGTVVVLNGAGDVLGLRRHAIAFRAHILEPGALVRFDARMSAQFHPSPRMGGGRGRRVMVPDRDPSGTLRLSTLPLSDGGVVVAFDRELVLLDSDGAVRARSEAPLSLASPLLALPHGVAFVGDVGEVYEWALASDPDSVRPRGTFGGSVEGNVAVEDARHLLAIVKGSRLVSLDLVTGIAETRATAAGGAFSDGLALARGTTYLQEITLGGTHVTTVDAAGRSASYPLALTVQGLASLGLGDAGAGGVLAPVDTKLFVDPSGAVAYATIDGHVGVATATTKHELGHLPCGAPPAPTPNPYAQHSRPSAGFAGLVPAADGAFVVACEAGGVSLVKGYVE